MCRASWKKHITLKCPFYAPLPEKNMLLAGTVNAMTRVTLHSQKLCGFSGLKTVDRWHRSPLINSFRWWANPLRDFWHGL